MLKKLGEFVFDTGAHSVNYRVLFLFDLGFEQVCCKGVLLQTDAP